ncbi:hypothetical protein ACOMHN_022647 [Nucella lapillus]
MNRLILLTAVCVAAVLTMAEARAAEDLTSNALEQLFHPQARRHVAATKLAQIRRQAVAATAKLAHIRRQAVAATNKLASKRAICDSSAGVMACLEPLEKMDHPNNGLNLDEMDTPESLGKLCQLLDTAKSCMNKVHADCGYEDITAHTFVEIMEGVVGFMCSAESIQLILDESECWDNQEMENALEQCTDVNADHPGEYCEAIEGMISCARNTVLSHCNQRTADFVAQLLYLAIEPVASNFLSCDMQQRVARSAFKLIPLRRRK